MNCSLIFFYELQFQKSGCCCRYGFACICPENSMGYSFMASRIVYVHISVKALKLLAIQEVLELSQDMQ